MRFSFVTDTEVLSQIMQFFGGLSASGRYWRALAAGIDQGSSRAVADAASSIIENGSAHRMETEVTAHNDTSVTIASRNEVLVSFRSGFDPRASWRLDRACYNSPSIGVTRRRLARLWGLG